MNSFRRIYSSVLAAVLAAALFLALTGCQQKTAESTETETAGSEAASGAESASAEETEAPAVFEPTVSSVFLKQDYTVQSAEITSFNTSRYSEADLRTQVEAWIAEYNESKGSQLVTLDELSVSDEKATLILSYANANAFIDFQGQDFGLTSLQILSAVEAAALTLEDMANASGEAVMASEIFADEDITVALVSGQAVIQTEGDIVYLSRSLTLTNNNTVRIDTDSVVFIVFK